MRIGVSYAAAVVLTQLALAAGDADEAFQWNDRAIRLQDCGHFREAGEAYERAIAAARDLPARERLRLAANLASLHLEQGAYDAARRVLGQAAGLARAVPPESRELAGYWNAAGSLNLIDGNLTAADQALGRAIDILESTPAGGELASALVNAAAVDIRRGHYKEARRRLERALTMLERAPGPHESERIRALASLSTAEYLRRDWEGAVRNSERALALARTHYGPNHPAVCDVMQNHAFILEHLHRGKEARAYRAQAKALLPAKPAVPVLADATEVQPAGVSVRSK